MPIEIHATLGPASFDDAVIRSLLMAGASAIRLNLSHCDRDSLPGLVDRIRRHSLEVNRSVRIGPDIRGRKLRIGPLVGGQATLVAGRDYDLVCVDEGEELLGDDRAAWVNHPLLAHDLPAGADILLDDGALHLSVVEAQGNHIACRICVGGALPERSGLNVPSVPLALPALTTKDMRDLDVISRLPVDFVYLSYVESGADIAALREALAARGRDLPIVAKVERHVAVQRLPEIAAVADAICLARGDLGVEVPLADIPFVQRAAVAQTHAAGKPFILAGEVLYAMIGRQMPARAELTDVAIAVEQGVDAFILSDETAIGVAPAVAVRTLQTLIDAITARLSRV
jgi:pyruvate kinase